MVKGRDLTGSGSDGRGRIPEQVPRRIQVRPKGPDGATTLPPQPLTVEPAPRAPATRREAREMAAAAAAQARVAQHLPSRRRTGRGDHADHHAPRTDHVTVRVFLLMTAVCAGLLLLPALGHRQITAQPMWVAAVLAVAAVVSVGPVTFRFVSRFRNQSLLLIGVLSSFVGLAILTVLHIAGQAQQPNLGHLLVLLGLPFVIRGLAIAPSGRPRRPFGTALLTLDAAMMSVSWLALLWMQWFQPFYGPGLLEVRWLPVLVLAAELGLLSVLLIMVAETGSRAMSFAVLLVLTLVAAQIVETLNHLSSAGAPVSVAPAGTLLLACSWVLSLLAAFTTRRSPAAVRQVPAGAGRWRGLVTLINVLIPLGFTFGGLAARGSVGQVTLLLTGAVLVIVGVRELVRVSQAHELVNLLASQALRDPLTGLGNRRALADRLGVLTQQEKSVSVLTLDVDRFKMVNTQFGHSTGDFVLTAVGAALRGACARVGAQAFRLGGDEFAIVVPGDLQVGLDLADRVRAAVQAKVNEVPGVENIALTSSVGVAQLNADGSSAEDPLQVLARSAEALRLAKQERNRVRAYSDDLAVETTRRARMESRLRLAVENGAITFNYQPVVDMRSGRVLGLESLARWRDPELGEVSPADFVPMAEQTGLIHELGRAAIENALRVSSRLSRSGVTLHIAVNVSPIQLRRDNFIDEVFELIAGYGARPDMLRVEVTEGIFMDADDPAVETLRQLAARGIGIAIDDFGSGYSSLGYMSRLPIDTVKVDRSLTVQISDARTRSVVKALLWVAESHGLQVILEGVENEQTAATLRRLGARRGQGWLWSGAVTEQDLPLTLRVLGTVPDRPPTGSARRQASSSRTQDVIRLP